MGLFTDPPEEDPLGLEKIVLSLRVKELEEKNAKLNEIYTELSGLVSNPLRKKTMTNKFIQIATHAVPETEGASYDQGVFGLTENGQVWRYSFVKERWRKLSDKREGDTPEAPR